MQGLGVATRKLGARPDTPVELWAEMRAFKEGQVSCPQLGAVNCTARQKTANKVRVADVFFFLSIIPVEPSEAWNTLHPGCFGYE